MAMKKESVSFDSVFKGFNASKRYPKETHHHVEVLTAKDEKNLVEL